MPESKPVRFAVLGYGHIGRRHAQLILANPDAELVALIDNKPSFTDEAISFEEVKRYTSLEQFLSHTSDIDVLCVCTPNYLHYPHTISALKHGMHVVCEKPMALKSKHCQEMIEVATATGKQLFCVMQNRYSPPAVWLKEIVESNKLGNIYHVQVNCFWNRDERYYQPDNWRGSNAKDGGTLYTQFSHFVDMLYWVFGDIKQLTGQFKNFNHHHLTEFEDSGFLQFEFEEGGFCTFNFSTSVHSQNLESSITVIAEKGSLKIGGQYMNHVEYCDILNYSLPNLPDSQPANNYGDFIGTAANHQFVIQNVINTLNGVEDAHINPADGLKVVETIEKMYALKAKKNTVI